MGRGVPPRITPIPGGIEILWIQSKKGGVIPVAILTTDDFDATTVDADTVRFGPRGAEKVHTTAHYEDVDGKGGFYSFLLSFFEIHGYLPLNYRKV